MCQMLLSINPQYVASIISGKKKYEYRKVRCRGDVDSILIYETAPTKRVIGEAAIDDILEDSLDTVWRMTGEVSGITKGFFDEYYRGKDKRAASENEIDLIIEENGVLYPIEIKMTGNPRASMAAANTVLDKIPGKIRGMGVILCLIDRKTYLRENLVALPVEYI